MWLKEISHNLLRVTVLPTIALLIDCDNDSLSKSGFEKNYESWKGDKVNSYIYNYEATGFSPLPGIWEI